MASSVQSRAVQRAPAGNESEYIMDNANVSQCANPECTREFKRLGEGKLFVRHSRKEDRGLTQKALWLCPVCAQHLDLRYDRRKQQYSLVRRRAA